MIPMTMAKLHRIVHADGFFASPDNDGGSVVSHFSEVKVFAPEGEQPDIRPMTEAEITAAAELYAEMKIDNPVPRYVVIYSRAIVFVDTAGNEGDGITNTNIKGMTPLALYVVDPASTSDDQDRTIPETVATSLIGKVDGEDRELDEEQAQYALAALSLFLKGLQKQAQEFEKPKDNDIPSDFMKEMSKVYGDVPVRKDSGSDEFVRMRAVDFTGQIGMISRKDGTGGVLRVLRRAVVLVAPSSQLEFLPVPQRLAEQFTQETDGQFIPAEMVRFRNAGLIEKNDQGAGMALGDFDLLLADGTSVEQYKLWSPKEPFDYIGVHEHYEQAKGEEAIRRMDADNPEDRDFVAFTHVVGRVTALN